MATSFIQYRPTKHQEAEFTTSRIYPHIAKLVSTYLSNSSTTFDGRTDKQLAVFHFSLLFLVYLISIISIKKRTTYIYKYLRRIFWNILGRFLWNKTEITNESFGENMFITFVFLVAIINPLYISDVVVNCFWRGLQVVF